MKRFSDDEQLLRSHLRLTSADGAIGSHANAVQGSRDDFTKLAKKIAQQIGLPV